MATRVKLLAVVFVERTADAKGGGELDLRRHVAEAGGHVVQVIQNLVLAWFDTATDCLQCCTQIASRGIRAGISIGDVLIENERLYGLPVNEASRLKDLAEPGQILCTTRTLGIASLARSEANELGEVRLKGIERPVPIAELR